MIPYLMQNKKINNIVHVVVLDGERIPDQIAIRLIEDGQLQDDQSRGPNLEPDPDDFDHARLRHVLAFHPGQLLRLDLVRVSGLDQVQVALVALLEVHEDVPDLREIGRLLGQGFGKPG